MEIYLAIERLSKVSTTATLYVETAESGVYIADALFIPHIPGEVLVDLTCQRGMQRREQ